MNKTEKNLWNRIKNYLPGVAERVENVVSPGFPDVSGTCPRGDYWIELKVTKRPPITTRVADLLEDSQNVWMVKRLRNRFPQKSAKNIFVLVGHGLGTALYKVYLTLETDVRVQTRLVADTQDLSNPSFIGGALFEELRF